jgi:hypothetical protein
MNQYYCVHALTLIHAYIITLLTKLLYIFLADDDDDEDGVLVSNEEDPDESYNSNENDALAAQGSLANDDCK